MNLRSLVTCAAMLAAMPSLARADTYAILAGPSVNNTDASTIAQAEAAIVSALRDERETVLTKEDVHRRMPATMRGCDLPTCIAAVLRETGADAAVVVTVWSEREAMGPREVAVTIFDGRASYSANADVGPHGLAQAAKAAVLDARSQQALGPGPWLVVQGGPSTARVFVDGRFAGSLPMVERIEVGAHEVEVRAAGFESYRDQVTVAEGDTQKRVHVRLVRVGERGTERSIGRASSPWNFVIGGAAAAGAAFAVGAVVRTIAEQDHCRGSRDGERDCEEFVDFNGATWGLLAAGVALTAGAVVMFWAQPIRVDANASATGASLTLRSSF